ncbi:MAG: glucose-1-phosphate adenylyltransferase [Alphaproteobacteria bacterium]|nr:glucose-1-phosphate adenylyltransferase [Alphaproteobacteria bacterium]
MITKPRTVSLTEQSMAYILAGGRGIRLFELTSHCAKPCLPFGGTGRVIDFPLSNALNSGIRRIGIAAQYQAQGLAHYLQQGWMAKYQRLGASLDLHSASAQGKIYRGTADAIYQNLTAIQAYHPHYLIILAADHIYKMDYQLMLEQHVETQADVTIACITAPANQAHHFGVMKVDQQDLILNFMEKPECFASQSNDSAPYLASMGIYIFNFDFLLDQLRHDAADLTSQHDFGRNIIPQCLDAGRVYAHRFERSCVRDHPSQNLYWRDIGTLDSYWAANLDQTGTEPVLDLDHPDWPIFSSPYFVVEGEEPYNRMVHARQSPSIVKAQSLARNEADLCPSLVFTTARVKASARVDESVILPHAEIGENVVLKNVIVDTHVKIPDGLSVGEDARLDSLRFRRLDSGLCLITQAMIDRLHEWIF